MVSKQLGTQQNSFGNKRWGGERNYAVSDMDMLLNAGIMPTSQMKVEL